MLLLLQRLALAFAGSASNTNKSVRGMLSRVSFMSFLILMLMLDDDWMGRRIQFGCRERFFMRPVNNRELARS